MSRILPPVYFLIAIILAVAVHFLMPAGHLLPFPWRLVGLPLLLLGIILNVLADRSLKRHKTAVQPFVPSRILVTEGAFRLSRHPMYLGMILMIAGIAFLLGSVTPWLIVVMLAILLNTRFIKIEESMLETTFGEAYGAYKKRVRMWL